MIPKFVKISLLACRLRVFHHLQTRLLLNLERFGRLLYKLNTFGYPSSE